MNLNYSIKYDENSEYDRLIFLSCSIFTKFFQSKRFFLTHQSDFFNPKIVLFPDINVKSIPNYWEDIKKIEENRMRLGGKEILITKLRDSGIVLGRISKNDLSLLSNKIDSLIPKLKQKLELLFPQFCDYKFQIEILPSLYGTKVSFTKENISEKEYIIKVSIRNDVPVEYIIEGIISILVYITKYSFNVPVGTWHEDWEINESIVDYIISHTLISELFPNYQPTIDAKHKTNKAYSKLLSESKRLYEQLGFPLKASLAIKKEEVLINEKKPKTRFSQIETKVLKHMIKNKNDLITNEAIEQEIWGDNIDKYSLWAISKLIQRTREKLKTNGLTMDIIQTIRGHGYLLYD